MAGESRAVTPHCTRYSAVAGGAGSDWQLLLDHDAGRDLAVLYVRVRANRTLQFSDARIERWVGLRGGDWLARDPNGRVVAWLALPPTGHTIDAEGGLVHESRCAVCPEGGFPPRVLRYEPAEQDPWVDCTLVLPGPRCDVPWSPLEDGWHITHPEIIVKPLIDAGQLDYAWRSCVFGQVYHPWPRDRAGAPRRPCARTALLLAQQAALLHRITSWNYAAWLAELVAWPFVVDAGMETNADDMAAAGELLLFLNSFTGDEYWLRFARAWARTLMATSNAGSESFALAGAAATMAWFAAAANDKVLRDSAARASETLAERLCGGLDAAAARQAVLYARAGAGEKAATRSEWLARLRLRLHRGAKRTVPRAWPDGYLEWDARVPRSFETAALRAHLAAANALNWLLCVGVSDTREWAERAVEWIAQPARVARLAESLAPQLVELAQGLCARAKPGENLAALRAELLLGRAAQCGAYSDVTVHPYGCLVPAGEARRLGIEIDGVGTRLFRLGGCAQLLGTLLCMNVGSAPQAVTIHPESVAGVRMPDGGVVDTTPIVALPPYKAVQLDLAPSGSHHRR